MPLAVLIALIVFAVAAGAGLAVAAQRGLAAWHALKQLRRNVNAGVGETLARLSALEAHAAAVPERLARLQAAQASLDQSLGEARVLVQAASEVTALVHGVRSFIPSR